jgi:hypothetical protein
VAEAAILQAIVDLERHVVSTACGPAKAVVDDAATVLSTPPDGENHGDRVASPNCLAT